MTKGSPLHRRLRSDAPASDIQRFLVQAAREDRPRPNQLARIAQAAAEPNRLHRMARMIAATVAVTIQSGLKSIATPFMQ